jgi:hypothetical protein
MIYRGPGFLAVVCFAPPLPLTNSKLDWQYTKKPGLLMLSGAWYFLVFIEILTAFLNHSNNQSSCDPLKSLGLTQVKKYILLWAIHRIFVFM